MTTRRFGRRPSLALWMLVAGADAALLLASGGVVVVLAVLTGLVLVAGAILGYRLLQRRGAGGAPGPVPESVLTRQPVMTGRRRA